MWKSTQLPYVADSSTFAEYGAINNTVDQVRFCKAVLRDLVTSEGVNNKQVNVIITNDEKGKRVRKDLKLMSKIDTAQEIHVDNLAAIHIASSQDGGGKRSKHILM